MSKLLDHALSSSHATFCFDNSLSGDATEQKSNLLIPEVKVHLYLGRIRDYFTNRNFLNQSSATAAFQITEIERISDDPLYEESILSILDFSSDHTMYCLEPPSTSTWALGLQALVLSMDTLQNKSMLVLPKHSPIQSDFRTPRIPLPQLSRLARDLLCGLSILHATGYVHGDVSLSNIVCKDETRCCADGKDDTAQYALIDLGLAQPLSKAIKCPRQGGTPGYIPPEVLMFSSSAERVELQNEDHTDEASDFARWSNVLGLSLSCRDPNSTKGSNYDCTIPTIPLSKRSLFEDVPAFANSSKPCSPLSSPSSSPTISVLSPKPPAESPKIPMTPSFLRRLCASRDIYSFGVVLGLLLSPYLPSCTNTSHLGGPRTDPVYIRKEVLPPLRTFHWLLTHRLPSSSPIALAVDLVIKCLAFSAVARPTAQKALNHPFCSLHEKSNCSDSDDSPIWETSETWCQSEMFTDLRTDLTQRKDEWTPVSQSELDELDVVDIALATHEEMMGLSSFDGEDESSSGLNDKLFSHYWERE
jgi:serine/threonine protein kinase